jgi:hypothetical protein
MSTRCMVVAVGCLLSLASATVPAQSAAKWQASQLAAAARADKIMAEAGTRKGLLAQYKVMREAYARDKSAAFRLLFGQYIGWYQTYLGDYPAAMYSFSIGQPAQPDDSPSPLGEAGYAPRPALDAIPELARGYRIVLLNEAHNVPLTRSLTVQLLERLRQQGFDYFAAETLSRSDPGLASRGYPTEASGFYTEEPIYAEMVRTALKLGFKVVAYESTSEASSGDARESEQARAIDEQVFKADPRARLVINAGYTHIVTSGNYLGGASMAEHLYKLTSIPMLSVEQTMMTPHPSSSGDHPYYTAAMQQLHPQAPIVFVNTEGKPWSLRPGYDVNVFFPPAKMLQGRPSWLSLGDLRHPYFVSGAHCDGHYPCLVEARYKNEGVDAIPADRMVLDLTPSITTDAHDPVFARFQNTPSGNLYLRPGRYRLSLVDEVDSVIHEEDIDVPDTPLPGSGQP